MVEEIKADEVIDVIKKEKENFVLTINTKIGQGVTARVFK